MNTNTPSQYPSDIRRTLRNGQKGRDVKALQAAVNRGFKDLKIEHSIATDGVLGPQSIAAVRQLAIASGVTNLAILRLKVGTVPVGVQRLIRGDRQKTERERRAYDRREKYRGKLKELYAGRPKIVTREEQGISTTALFGALGSPKYVTGHYTAGPRDESDDHAVELNKRYDTQHRSNGWGGIGYHYCIGQSGTIFCLRDPSEKGAHVGLYNSNNVGVMMHGTVGDEPSKEQKESYRWLLKNAHTDQMPQSGRVKGPLFDCNLKGHNDWPGHQSNSCPGQFKPMYVSGGIK